MARASASATAALLAGGLLLAAGAADGGVLPRAPASTCPVSSTSSHPVSGRPSFNAGSARIAVALPKGARFLAVPDGRPGWASIQRDGWIRTKLGWFTARGAPRIVGRRVDRADLRLRAHVGPLSSASDGIFYPSILTFPSLGCWRITATAGGARIVVTVNVVRAA